MAQKLNVLLMTVRRDIEKMSHVARHVGPDKGGLWEIREQTIQQKIAHKMAYVRFFLHMSEKSSNFAA